MKKHFLSFVFWLGITLLAMSAVASWLNIDLFPSAWAAENPLILRNKPVPNPDSVPMPNSDAAGRSSTVVVPNSQSNSQTIVVPTPLDKLKNLEGLKLDDPKSVQLEDPKLVPIIEPKLEDPKVIQVEEPKLVLLEEPKNPKTIQPEAPKLEPQPEDPKAAMQPEDPKLETLKPEDPKLETPKPEDPKVTPNKRLTPADFLVKTVVPQLETQPIVPSPGKELPKTAQESPKDLGKEPAKPVKVDPAKQALADLQKELEDPKSKPKQDPKKDSQPKAGDPLKIPDTAKENKDLGFLEGCWVGTRPEYASKRIIKEQFCFDAKGIGKRRVFDPQYAGTCIGATKAVVNNNGVLEMNSSQMACDRGDAWAASSMICIGEGEKTPCSWVFRDENGRTHGQQSYTINFVRE